MGKKLQWSAKIYEGTWQECLEWAASLNEGGYRDWRLPTIHELQKIFSYKKGKPKIGGFQPHYHWSSLTFDSEKILIWQMNLSNGCVTYKAGGTNYARCVRRKDNDNG